MTSPWKKSVAVTLDSVNPVQYTIEPTGSDPLPVSNGALVFNNDHRNGFDVDFIFTDKTNSGYLWPPNNLKDKAIWSKLGTACPGSPDTDIFHAVTVDQTRTVLTANNPNVGAAVGAFQYTLCVTNDGGTSYLNLDPGGINNNGPISAGRSSSMTIVVALAAIAIVALALYEFGVFR